MNLLEQVEKAGVIGCGGAGFPTHIKWKAKAECFIINGVECEPLLATDKHLMRHRADDLIYICGKAAEMLQAEETIIAIKETYTAEIAALEKAIGEAGADVRIHRLHSFYPAGDEQLIVCEVTGRTVPCGGIPLDVGVVVSNIATMIAAFDAMAGKSFTEKYITVAGAVKRPVILKAPLGTGIGECVEAAGGAVIDDYLIVIGGPMMGKDISCEEEDRRRVTKTTSGILILPKEGFMEKYKGNMDLPALQRRARTACIQCSYCTMLCPRHLLGHPLAPHRIMRTIAFAENLNEIFSQESITNASLCSLCGVCTVYACPMGLQPSKVNSFLKDEMKRRGIRRQTKETTVPQADREWRKVPTSRLNCRIETAAYHPVSEEDIVEIRPEEVAIALRQGPGRLPDPLVAVGDVVEAGALIAAIPEGDMGSNLHASVEGIVVEISDVIRIRRTR